MKRFLSTVMATLAAGCAGSESEPAGDMPAGCTPDVVRDGSMLHQLVYDAEPIREGPPTRAILPKSTKGAKLFVRAEKGMTAEYLKRAADCHAASSDPSLSPHDPLRPPGARPSIQVSGRGAVFVVSVTADSRAEGEAIWERAQALVSGQAGE